MAGEPVAPGQYLRISAKDWNEVRARLRNQRAGGDRNEGLKLSLGTVPSCSILVHNSSSSITYPAQGVVGLPNHAIDPAGAPVDNALRPVGLAGLPDGVMPYGIAMIPIPPGQTGYVVVSGVSSANIEVTNIDHEYAVAISGDNTKLTTAESGPIRLLTRFGSTASNAVGLVFVGVVDPLEVGNTATEYTGATTDGPATEIKAVKPVRLKQDATDVTKWTVALIPPTEEDAGYTTADLVTNVCPIKKWLSITLSGDPLVATPVLNDTEVTRSVEIVTGINVESTPVKVLPGSMGEPACVDDPDDCCPADPCPGCTCSGLENLNVGTNTFTAVPVTSHDGIAEGEFYMQWALDWLFCPPRGECSYTVTVTGVNATYTGTCINPSFFGAPFVFLQAKSLVDCADDTSLASNSQNGTCDSTFPTAAITIPAAETDCTPRKVRFTINVYSDTDSPAAVADFVITIAEAVCS